MKVAKVTALFALAFVSVTGGMNSEASARSFKKSGSHGLASWYGPGFNGRKTASGERFNTRAFTAAHRSLPFGTRVKVTNVKTGRTVVVRINDRGPFVGGRVIDLSHASARAIGVAGVAPVRLSVI